VAIAFGANALFSVAPSVLRSAGDPDAYAFLQTQPGSSDPVRYDPCSPLRYVINRDMAPAGAVEDLEEAIELFEDAMKVDFVFVGYTEEVPSEERPIHQPQSYGTRRWAPILFGWVPPEQLLQPDDQAVGAAGSTYVENDRGDFVYVTGVVTFNADAKLLSGFELGDSWGDVALHELGHLVGLAHVDDDNQVMYPDVTAGEARLGAGDLRGLELLGRDPGCVAAPEPRRR
ncbi:MAG: matrixin family metalloprotease, partial [Actinobacteria bacterium]|nr:matrixin family metalloprotease [Actinomycetota bacterium]